jgi:circadian clock protein KaiC
MLNGGLIAGTITVVIGASGAGKTTLGSYFLGEASKAEPALHYGFYESPRQLIANAAVLGVNLEKKIQAGHLRIVWRPPVERILDSLGNEIIDEARAHKVKRLFIDGWGGFMASAESPDRVPSFFAAVANELRSLGVATMCAIETPNLVGPEVQIPVQGISAITENMILLRFTEYQARLYRVISILKARGGSFDPTLREFHISERGVELADSFESAERLLSGTGVRAPRVARKPPRARASRKSKSRRRG